MTVSFQRRRIRFTILFNIATISLPLTRLPVRKIEPTSLPLVPS